MVPTSSSSPAFPRLFPASSSVRAGPCSPASPRRSLPRLFPASSSVRAGSYSPASPRRPLPRLFPASSSVRAGPCSPAFPHLFPASSSFSVGPCSPASPHRPLPRLFPASSSVRAGPCSPAFPRLFPASPLPAPSLPALASSRPPLPASGTVGLLYPTECKASRAHFVNQCHPTWVKLPRPAVLRDEEGAEASHSDESRRGPISLPQPQCTGPSTCVYGDLSTSPLYVYKSTFVEDIQHSKTSEEIYSALSFVF